MMAITHAAIAAAGVSLLLSTADPLPLALAVLGSQLPDLDTTSCANADLEITAPFPDSEHYRFVEGSVYGDDTLRVKFQAV